MEQEERELEQKQFIEEFALLFELMALPRMAGRILGWLMICNPPHQSTGQLAEVLQASKGSISTMTRLLIQSGLVERVSLPGERRDFFCIKLGAWPALLKQRMAQITAIRELAGRGLKILENGEPQQGKRLQEMYEFHGFFERQFPLLIERWETEQRQNSSNLK
ncbi:MAG TPA: MarR family transcriptional regulator [Halomicronema sp.]